MKLRALSSGGGGSGIAGPTALVAAAGGVVAASSSETIGRVQTSEHIRARVSRQKVESVCTRQVLEIAERVRVPIRGCGDTGREIRSQLGGHTREHHGVPVDVPFTVHLIVPRTAVDGVVTGVTADLVVPPHSVDEVVPACAVDYVVAGGPVERLPHPSAWNGHRAAEARIARGRRRSADQRRRRYPAQNHQAPDCLHPFSPIVIRDAATVPSGAGPKTAL